MPAPMALAAASVATLAVAVLAGCSDGGAAAPDGSPAPSRTAPATTVPPPAVSPLTGAPGGAGPVLAVKIDNVRAARPSTGLTSADLVYVEPVEGGLSRLLAVWSSRLPERVGPVRSARESDLELLRQFGRPAFAYSGANPKVLPAIRRAPLADVSPAAAGGAYRRAGDRRAPHNLFARPDRLLREAGRVDRARDVGLRFGPAPAGGTPAADRTVRYPAARVGFSWSAQRGRYLVSFDGRPATDTDGGRLSAATAVVQQVEITASRYRDSAGNPTPSIRTVGEGAAVVLRDGAAHGARWSRPRADAGTTFTTASGAPLPFATGPVWVVLTDRTP